MKVRIEIDTKTFVRFWLVVIAFAFVIMAIYSARTALILLAAAFFLALALNEPVTRLARHLPGRSRVGGTAIAFVVVVALLGIFLFLVVPPIVQQTVRFVDSVPAFVNMAQMQSKGLNHFIQQYHLQAQVNQVIDSIKNGATGWATNVGKNIAAGLGSLIGTITSLLLVLVLAFLMLVEGPEWIARLWHLYRDEDQMEHHRELAHRMYGVVTGYVTGQLTVSAIGAAASGLTVFILSFFFHVPANLALPTVAVTFTLSLIPMFGATIAGLIMAVLIAFNDVTAAIIFIVFFFLYQQLENNFVAPTIQSKRLELSALTVLASVTIGLYVFGLAGGIVSIPIAGCLKVLLDDYLRRAKDQRTRSEKPLVRLAKKLTNQSDA